MLSVRALNEPAGQRDDILPKYEGECGQQHPEAAHLHLLPPCQFALDLDDLDFRPFSVEDTVSTDHFLFGRHGATLGLVFK